MPEKSAFHSRLAGKVSRIMGGFLQAFWAQIASVGSRGRGLQKGYSKFLNRFIEASKNFNFFDFFSPSH
jgi:hypothetical protein